MQGFRIDNNLPLNHLNEEETLKYLKMYREGNEEAKEILIINNIKFIKYIINKNFNKENYEIDDLISEGVIGLIKSIESFDESKHVKFATYSYRCIYNEIVMYIKKINKDKTNTVSENCSFSSYSELILNDILENENINIENEYIKKQEEALGKSIFNFLTGEKREIIKLLYGFEGEDILKQSDIKRKLNLPNKNMSALVNKINKSLRKKVLAVEAEQNGTTYNINSSYDYLMAHKYNNEIKCKLYKKSDEEIDFSILCELKFLKLPENFVFNTNYDKVVYILFTRGINEKSLEVQAISQLLNISDEQIKCSLERTYNCINKVNSEKVKINVKK